MMSARLLARYIRTPDTSIRNFRVRGMRSRKVCLLDSLGEQRLVCKVVDTSRCPPMALHLQLPETLNVDFKHEMYQFLRL